MVIKVIGKAHKEGIGKKTGNPYSFNEIHYIGKRRGVEGECGLSSIVDEYILPLHAIKIGEEYDVQFDNRGNILDMIPVNL